MPGVRLRTAALVAAVTFAVFSPSLSNGFVQIDDPDYVVKNPVVQKGLSGEGFVWAFTTNLTGNWHPLTWLSHELDVAMWGERAWGHHLTSVLFHAANAALLFLLLFDLTQRLEACAFVALLFALHPLRVESVAWVSERKDVLSAFFGLLSLWAYGHYAQWRSRRAFAWSIVAFAAGLLSKGMLVTLPGVMLLLDAWPLKRREGGAGWRRLVFEKWPFALLAAGSAVSTYLVQTHWGTVAKVHSGDVTWLAERVVMAYWAYVGKMLWPVHLSALYPQIYVGWSTWVAVIAALALVGSIAVAITPLGRRSPWGMGWLWFVGVLFPVVGIVPVGLHFITDRFTYLPSIGFFIALVFGLPAAWLQSPRSYRTVMSSGILLLGVLTYKTLQQIPTWKDAETLFANTMKETPDNPPMEVGLGFYRMEQGRLPEAEALMRHALAAWPFLPRAISGLGVVLAHEERWSEALPYLERGHERSPRDETVQFALGRTRERLGNDAGAREMFALVADKQPADAVVHLELSGVLMRLNHPDEATKTLEDCAAVAKPDDRVKLLRRLGSVYARRGMWEDAQRSLRAVLTEKPEDVEARTALKWVDEQAAGAAKPL